MDKKFLKIAIAGNPNSGKTSLFNRITKANQHVANYPGITVEYAEGEATFGNKKVRVIDLPGTYSLTAYSPEEVVARDFLLKENVDVIVNVVDASNLERNLYLTTQLLLLNFPMVIALNMVDSAEAHGITVDSKRLADIFGVKVVPTIAKSGCGIEELKQACIQTIEEGCKIKKLSFPHPINESILQVEKEIEKINTEKRLPSRWLALKLLEDDPLIIEMLRDKGNPAIFAEYEKAKKFLEFHSGDDSRTSIVEAYYSIASGACRDCIRMSETRKRHISDKIDQITCNRFIGPILLFLIVYFLFAFVFKISEEWKWIPLFNGEFESPTGILESFFDYLSESAKNKIQNDFLRSLISDGIISGVGGILSFTPLIFFMFLFIAAIEDTGYMARIAFILDRVLRIFGLQGKSILPLLLTGGIGGGGCAVPGILAARTMREEKDRLITILVAPMMNCGAKLPVYAMLISAFFYKSKTQMMFTLWFLSWIFTLSAAFLLRKFLFRGEQTPFVMELPVYHLPTLRGIMMHSIQRTW
ncbi:MAG TPA: ferrous iron transport protein B, partial [Victivallales bacterium]|nr:ferrous iron transport protein B [Victivallales bacterium]